MPRVTIERAMRMAYQHYQADRLAQAETICREVLAQHPHHGILMALLAAVVIKNGRHQEAIELLRRAIEFNPDNPTLYNNLGAAYGRCGRFAEAVPVLRRAMELDNRDAKAHYNLAKVLKDTNQLDQAAAALHQAIRLDPTLFEAYENLGNIYKDQGQMDQALDLYRQSSALRPHESLRYANQLYSMTFHPCYDAAAILKAHEPWDRLCCQPLRQNIPPHPNDRLPGRRLRIGYVGAYFRNHCQSFFTVPLFSHHDRQRFELFCYSDLAQPDSITRRIRGYADAWRNTAGLSDERLAQTIRKDRIDILVDLTMHMAGNRLAVFARKPAPLQLTWLAYPGTTGLPAIDYRLSDPYLDPDSAEVNTCYAEKTYRLPDTFWCYDPLTAEPEVNPLPVLTAGHIIFGCLNNFCKVTDISLDLWTGVLKRIDRSRLILSTPPGNHRQRTTDFLAARGIDPGRIEFVTPVPREEYLRRYHRIDIGLDTLPYNGHTTSLDSLWMGVPIVTLLGKTVVGRAGLSQLSNLGLMELVANTPEQFVQIACDLAGDLDRLKTLRSQLRHRMRTSPLGDGARFARNVEAAFGYMWDQWCSQKMQ